MKDALKELEGEVGQQMKAFKDALRDGKQDLQLGEHSGAGKKLGDARTAHAWAVSQSVHVTAFETQTLEAAEEDLNKAQDADRSLQIELVKAQTELGKESKEGYKEALQILEAADRVKRTLPQLHSAALREQKAYNTPQQWDT